MTKQEQLQKIHDSFVNGQKRQAVGWIKEYGLYDFFSDYKEFLKDICPDTCNYQDMVISSFEYFTDATISYMRITNR
jgi:hypothetical protein